MSRMTNRPQASWTWTLRRPWQHKVFRVGISAPQSLAFDPKGSCSQHRMKDCIVPVTLTSLISSTPNYTVKESWNWVKHVGSVLLSHIHEVLVTGLNWLKKHLKEFRIFLLKREKIIVFTKVHSIKCCNVLGNTSVFVFLFWSNVQCKKTSQ